MAVLNVPLPVVFTKVLQWSTDRNVTESARMCKNVPEGVMFVTLNVPCGLRLETERETFVLHSCSTVECENVLFIIFMR